MVFHHPAELGLPFAVTDHPVDRAVEGTGLPTQLFRAGEVDMPGGADRVVRVEHSLDQPAAIDLGAGDGGHDPLAGHVGEHLIFELGRAGGAGADQVVVEPLADDGLQLAEEVELRLAVVVAPFVQHQVGGQLVDNLGRADVAGVGQGEVDLLADDA